MTVSGRDQRGFSLLELLVAMTLLGFVFMLLYGSLSFGTRVWERTVSIAADLSDTIQTQSLLRRHLESAMPVPLADADASRTTPHFFEGTPSQVRFSAPSPAEALKPGVYEILYSVVDDADGAHLAIQWRLTNVASGPQSRRDAANAEGAEILLSGASEILFQYFGNAADGSGGVWHGFWDKPTELPALIRVDVAFPEGDRRQWPFVLAAPMGQYQEE